MVDTTDVPKIEKKARGVRSEVQAMLVIEGVLEPFDGEARQRIALYFASRVGFDIGLLLNGDANVPRM